VHAHNLPTTRFLNAARQCGVNYHQPTKWL